MIPLTPGFLIAAANAFIGIHEEGGDNRGQMIEMFLREVRQPPGQPWCAAFVHHCGYWSHYEAASASSSWPLPPTASCTELAAFAARRGKLLKVPMRGDVFLLYSRELGRFHHTGIVVSVDAAFPTAGQDFLYQCTTIEGNTNNDGSPNGNAALKKTRRLNTFVGDAFIRWVELEVQSRAA